MSLRARTRALLAGTVAAAVAGLKLTIIVDTWVSDRYGDPHAEVHPHHPAA